MSVQKDSSSLFDKLIERTFNSFPGGSDDWRINTLLHVRVLCVLVLGPMVHSAIASADLKDEVIYLITGLAVIGLIRITSNITRLVIAVIDRANRSKPLPNSDTA